MTTSLNSDLVRQTLRRLLQANAECVRAEAEAITARDRAATQAEKTYSQVRNELEKQFSDEQTSLIKQYQTERTQLNNELDMEAASIEKEFASATSDIALLYESDEEITSKELQEANWTLEAIFDAHNKEAQEKLDATRRQMTEHREVIHGIRAEVATLLADWQQIPKAIPGISAVELNGNEPQPMISARIAGARKQVQRLKGLIAPRFLIGDRMLYIGLAVSLIVGVAAIFITHFALKMNLGAMLITVLASAAVFGGGGTWFTQKLLTRRLQRQVHDICEPLHRQLAEAETLCRQGEELEDKRCQEAIAAGKLNFRKEQHRAEKLHRENLANALARRDDVANRAVKNRDHKREALNLRRNEELEKVDTDHKARLAAIQRSRDEELSKATGEYERQRAENTKRFDDAFAALASTWNSEWSTVREAMNFIAEQDARFFPNWHAADWSSWQPATSVPPSMRFGTVTAHLHDRPKSPELEQPPQLVTLPAMLSFPHKGSTLLRAGGEGRVHAAHLLFSMALRFLTSLPAGKVRLTIVDPVGLGENFAALMHLADFDPQLVGARIWTEPQQIEKRLADLTSHMENVIQKYLRSQYASIEDYNTQAGEVAEPYRILVVANFPANFTTEAARRLERIAANGASCGVYTLIAHDPALPIPQDFDIVDLQRASLNLHWEKEYFVLEDSELRSHELKTDVPLTGTALFKTLEKIGSRAKDANRVEVDFSFIAPPLDKYWSSDSRGGIDVPLGRAGATKRQHLQLGKGTAQHVIVAGKTGSGKSTLLHALITNLALHFGPDEIELYLIDFKKGVEFKTYATHHLPHARVIAIESEREFGLSVLQRLDVELKRRGEIFRNLGVQDVRAFRDTVASANGPTTNDHGRMPRILLIVDEFQEFFVEDDRVSQEAALLLDRLVRQGRAFGLHVLLGSQTLGGAYSLARSTIDQMAVRIALQCSEADAGLILSKDNNAARLLSRPGEAIYNDANGLLEGNEIFQVCWLNEDRREQYLTEVGQRAEKAAFQPPTPTVVFEGNIPSDLSASVPLRKLMEKGPPDRPGRELEAWLGDAMAIKEPTAALFRRQSSSNLLLLGQQPDGARALVVAAAAAALAQQPPVDPDEPAPRVMILDGTPADDPHARFFHDHLAKWPGVRIIWPREVPDALRLVASELERRQIDSAMPPALLLVVYGLHRLRDLRKPEDDFGFSKKDGEPTPAQRFSNLLREGPAFGIHSMVWCDTLVNFQRAAERSALREYEMKVLFQMSANDSSSLIDSPMASRLGVNRALFAHDELSTPEKFRPYSLPDETWLSEMGVKLKKQESVSVS